jgi:hypothetical protein
MVPDALHDIPGHPGVEIGNGQVHQLDKKLGYRANIDPDTYKEQYQAQEYFHTGPPEKQNHLRHQDHIDKPDVLVLDAHIDYTLRQEEKNKLKKTAHQQSNAKLYQQVFIVEQMSEQKA